MADARSLAGWQARIGEFVNWGQVVIDRLISCGVQKWGRMSGLVMRC
ncbi:hypothetical protein [Salmonella enterica]